MRTILLVEDSAAARSFVRGVLESREFSGSYGGCEVVEAGSGFEAMRHLAQRPCDLIVTDIHMADINGLELIRFIRKSARHGTTPVLAISNLTAKEDRQRGLALGADAYLAKPFTPEELGRACGALLEAGPRKGWSDAPPSSRP